MHQLYRDYADGQFIPDVKVTKRADNGHFTATACGLEVTHHDQEVAINKLTEKLHTALIDGTLHPGSGS